MVCSRSTLSTERAGSDAPHRRSPGLLAHCRPHPADAHLPPPRAAGAGGADGRRAPARFGVSDAPRTSAFVNATAGGADGALRVLREDPRVSVRIITSPASLAAELQEAVARGEETVVVAGGDGTLTTAAAALVDRDTALGVVPAGTLNHFAHDHGLPGDPAAALEVALGGRRAGVDVAAVNGRIFLNTSAVGAYVTYVRTRERWAPRLGYYGASLVAAAGTFARLHSLSLELEVAGQVRCVRSPLVFVGVGERELRPPRVGARREDGRRDLHVLIVRHTPRLRLLGMALRTLLGGIRPWARTGEVECLLVQRCTITVPASLRWAAADGEIVPVRGPLTYSYRRDALTVRVPEPSA
jgi:diacylglycerol kinase family enzyme